MDINHLAIDINEWANKAFPDRTPQSMFLKMYHEMSEMIDETDKPEVEGEIADVLIMILDFARQQGVNPSVAIQAKMRINRARTWKQNPLGDYSHVKDAPCVPEELRSGSGDAPERGQALAHDRDNTHPNTGGTHGQRSPVELAHLQDQPGDIFHGGVRSGSGVAARSGGEFLGGYPDPFQGVDRARPDQSSRGFGAIPGLPEAGG